MVSRPRLVAALGVLLALHPILGPAGPACEVEAAAHDCCRHESLVAADCACDHGEPHWLAPLRTAAEEGRPLLIALPCGWMAPVVGPVVRLGVGTPPRWRGVSPPPTLVLQHTLLLL